MTKTPLLGALGAALVFLLTAVGAQAAPTFPPLTGRVVDNAHLLTPAASADLSARLAALEASTTRQVVVVTLPSLQGYPIEDYGYQLGRAWGIGQKGQDNGVLFIVAPAEHATRIEVGYGLEPVLTDALSNLILQQHVLPRFKAGDMQGGVVEGAQAIIDQLSLPDDEAKAKVARAAAPPARSSAPLAPIIFLIILAVFVLPRILGGGGGLLPWILLGGLGGGRGDGFGGGGGGGFSGGGGGFGGGGSSGSW